LSGGDVVGREGRGREWGGKVDEVVRRLMADHLWTLTRPTNDRLERPPSTWSDIVTCFLSPGVSFEASRSRPFLGALGFGLAKNTLGYITGRLSPHRKIAQDHFLAFTVIPYECDNGSFG